MSVKKAKGKGKSAAKTAVAKKSSPKPKKGKDIVEVRENINELVKESAEDIATSVIEVATRTGQLASAKYLFEAVGLYPANEQSDARPLETTMAHQLLTRMGIPLEPVVQDEDGEVIIRDVKAVSEAVEVEEQKPAERNHEENTLPEDEA